MRAADFGFSPRWQKIGKSYDAPYKRQLFNRARPADGPYGCGCYYLDFQLQMALQEF